MNLLLRAKLAIHVSFISLGVLTTPLEAQLPSERDLEQQTKTMLEAVRKKDALALQKLTTERYWKRWEEMRELRGEPAIGGGDVFDEFLLVFPQDISRLSAVVGNSKVAFFLSVAPANSSRAFDYTRDALYVFQFRNEGEQWKVDDFRLHFLEEWEGAQEKYEARDSTVFRQKGLLRSGHKELPENAQEGGALLFNSGFSILANHVWTDGNFISGVFPPGRITIPISLLKQDSQVEILGKKVADTEDYAGKSLSDEKAEAAWIQERKDRKAFFLTRAKRHDAAEKANEPTGRFIPVPWGDYEAEHPEPGLQKEGPAHFNTASMLPTLSRHSLPRAIAFGKDGVLMIGAGYGLQAPGASDMDLVNGRGTLLRYDASTGTFLNRVLLGPRVEDIAVDDDGYVYIAGSNVLKLNPSCTRIIWQSAEGGKRIHIADDGRIILSGTITKILDSEGKLLTSFRLKAPGGAFRGSSAGCWDEKNQHVIIAGAYNRHTHGNPVWIPGIVAYNLDGERIWSMYGFPGHDVGRVSDMADGRIDHLEIGPDGKLYFLGNAEGGNHVFRHDPQIPGAKIDGGHIIHNTFGDKLFAKRAFKLGLLGKANPANGKVEKVITFYTNGRDHVEGKQDQRIMGTMHAHSLSIGEDGRVHVVGESNGKLFWQGDAYNKIDPPVVSQDYYGHVMPPKEPFYLVTSPDLKVEFLSGFGNDPEGRYEGKFGEVVTHKGKTALIGHIQPFRFMKPEKDDPKAWRRPLEDEPVPEAEEYYWYRNAFKWSFDLDPKYKEKTETDDGEEYKRRSYFMVFAPPASQDIDQILKAHLNFLPLVDPENIALRDKLLASANLEETLKPIVDIEPKGKDDKAREAQMLRDQVISVGRMLNIRAKSDPSRHKNLRAAVEKRWGSLLDLEPTRDKL